MTSGVVSSTLWLGFIFFSFMYHYLLPGGCGLPRSKQWVAALKCPLLDIPCSCSFFFRASTCLCFCAFKLTLVPTIATVHLFCLLALASYKLCYPFCFSFVDYAAFQKLLHFFLFFFFVCVCVNKRFTRSLHILALFSCSHTVECSVIACWFFYSLSAFSCRILYSISIRCNAVKVMQVQSPKFIALRVPSMLRCTPAAFARASMHMRLLRLC